MVIETLHPHLYYPCSGIGYSNTSQLNAFDNALIDAGVGQFNLLKVSSILPNKCVRLGSGTPKDHLQPGNLLPIAYADMNFSNDVSKYPIYSVVAIGVPENPSDFGVIMEDHGRAKTNQPQHIRKDKIIKMVQEAMRNRNIKIGDIVVEYVEFNQLHENKYKYVTTFAGIALF